MKKIARLHYLTQDNVPGFTHLDQVKMACEVGVKWIQVRTKEEQLGKRRRLLSSCMDICSGCKATVVINDFTDLALELGAGGVHLGISDGDPEQARQVLGEDKIIGLSSHNEAEILRGKKYQADYLGLGPFGFTRTKSKLSPLLGLPGLQKILPAAGGIPVIAIGGIKPGDVPGLMAAGVHGIAVSSAINLSENPAGMLRTFLDLVQSHAPQPQPQAV